MNKESLRTPGLLITGPVGIGKTTIAFEVSEILEQRSIPHAFLDADIAYLFPYSEHDPACAKLGLSVLASTWRVLRDAGAQRLILTRVVMSPQQLAELRHTLPDLDLLAYRLTAPPIVIFDRITKRELGSGRDWHLARSEEQLQQLAGSELDAQLVETAARSTREIAEDIVRASGWCVTA